MKNYRAVACNFSSRIQGGLIEYLLVIVRDQVCVAVFLYYWPAGFLDKNRDTFSADLVDLVGGSKSAFLLELFARERAMVCTPWIRSFRIIVKADDFRMRLYCKCLLFRVKIQESARQLLELSSRSLLIYSWKPYQLAILSSFVASNPTTTRNQW